MPFLRQKTGKLTRYHIPDLSDKVAITGTSNVSTMVDYLDGNYKQHIAAGLIRRYAHRITKNPDAVTIDNGSPDDQVYYSELQLGPKAAIEAGLFEILGTEYYQKISRHAASLSSDIEFEFVTEGGADADEFGTELLAARDAAGFRQRLGRCDEIAVATGSACMHVQVLGGKFVYTPVPANMVWFAYANGVVEDDEDRAVDMLNIEEASVVVVQLDSGENNTYVAYFPRSDMYPRGRMVKYEAKRWQDIPSPWDGRNAVEATDNAGEIANPLTVLQDDSGDYTRPEVPVIPWIGTIKGIGTSIIPVDSALYNTCVELDMSLSRAFTSLNKSATGNLIFTTEKGASPVWADNLGEGVNMLKPGQSAIMLNLPPAGGEALLTGVEKGGAMIGDSYGVPDYLLAVGDSVNVPSGAALMELNQPAAKMRRKRADINTGNMDRLFKVEVSLAAIDNEDPSFGAGIEQKWIVKDMSYVKTDEQRLNEAKLAKELKLKGQRELIRDYVEGMENASDEQIDAYIADLKLDAAPAAPALGRFSAATQAAQR